MLAKLKHQMSKSRQDPVAFLEQFIQVSFRSLLVEGQKKWGSGDGNCDEKKMLLAE